MRSEKSYAAMLLAALIAVSSSCSDISSGDIKVHSVENMQDDIITETEEAPENDDMPDIILVTDPDGFVTTGDETREPETSVSAKKTTEKTTFPIQTTPDEPMTLAPDTSGTTAPPVTTATTTSASTEAASSAAATAAAPAETSVPVPEAVPMTTTASSEINYNVIGENGILVSYQNGHYRGLMACFGTYGLCEKWAGAVNKFAAKLPDVRVYTMAAPISSEFYTPQKFWDSGFTVSQYNKCEHIRKNLSGATYVDAYSVLKEHTDEDIYSRTDHHWNPLGAYYAAGAFSDAAGVDFPDISKYTPVSRSGYVGSMYTYSKDYHIYNDPETFTMYLSPNADRISTTYYNTSFGGAYKGDLFVSRNAASFYCSFIGSDDRITKIETDVKNGRTLVVFKQSFGNALIPFLTSGFERIYVCDMRYFNLNGVQFCKDVGATDLLLTDCVMIAAGNGGKYLELLLNK